VWPWTTVSPGRDRALHRLRGGVRTGLLAGLAGCYEVRSARGPAVAVVSEAVRALDLAAITDESR